MERKISLFGLVIVLVLLIGCSNGNPQDQAGDHKNEGDSSIEEDLPIVIQPTKIENYPQTLYAQTSFDFNQDSKEELIKMFVDAGKDENGELVWDDGQRWLLVVDDGENTYPLFDDWVQLGSLTYWIFTTHETPVLALLQTGTAGFHLRIFTYNQENKTYQVSTVYNPENINMLHYTTPLD